MLELAILKYMMQREGESAVYKGHLSDYSLSYFRELNDIPKATYYRALNELISMGFIVKKKRNSYVLSQEFRAMSNLMKQASEVRL